MSLPPSEPPPHAAPKPDVPQARPRRRRAAIPVVAVDPTAEAVAESSAWTWHDGWLWSLGAHGLVLLILGLWLLTPKSSQVATLDTRLEGSDLGRDSGLAPLGGLDTPLVLPDTPLPTLADAPIERIKPLDLAPDSMAGSTTSVTNPGVGAGDGFGVAKFGSGGESVRGVEVQVGDPQFTLLWNTPVDIDLYVTEPGGKTIWWNDRSGRQGGELDVDNTEGFGPENIYWLKRGADGSRELGPGPPGEYIWHVEYYGGNGGMPLPTRWRVRIKHNGQVQVVQGRLNYPKERSRNYSLKVGDPSLDPASPPPTAPSR